MNNIPIIDMIFFVIIVLMIIHGYVRGFITELFSWASIILAIFAAVSLYHPGADFIRTKIMQTVKYVPEVLSFIIIFVLVMMVLKMVEHVLKDIVEGAKLGGVNKFLGLFFGLLEGVALVAVILFVLSVQPVFDASKVIGDSFFAQFLLPLIKIPLNRGKEAVKTAFLFMQNSGASGFFV